MDYDPIKKGEIAELQVEPNLLEYERAREEFRWEDVKKEGKEVIRNSVAKVGNLFNIEEGSDATIDDAVSFVRSLDSTIEDIIRTKDGITIIRLDDDGVETSKKINATTKIGFI